MVVIIANFILNNHQIKTKTKSQNDKLQDLRIKKMSSNPFENQGYLSYLTNCIKNIVRVPFYLIRNIFNGFKYYLTRVKKKFLDKKFHRKDALYAFYDLDVMSSSFDIIPFLIYAEKIRIFKGLESLHVIIVPGSHQGFAKGYFEYYQSMTPDKEKIRFAYLEWRVRNILIPCCWLMPSCKQMTVCASRKEPQEIENLLAEHIFPDHYLVNVPINPNKNIYLMGGTPDNLSVPSLSATQTACDFVSEWLNNKCQGKKVVTITLREASYELDRNSNIQNWEKFARSLDQNIYYPVIIRDTERAFQSIPKEMVGLTFFLEASWNLEIRAAFYQMSYLNLFVSGGPMILSWFNNKCRCLIFKLITDSISVTTEKNLNFVGLNVGDQPLYFSKFQKLVWADDNYEVIKNEFDEMCIKIEESSHTPQ
jgi:hypothetical protein